MFSSLGAKELATILTIQRGCLRRIRRIHHIYVWLDGQAQCGTCGWPEYISKRGPTLEGPQAVASAGGVAKPRWKLPLWALLFDAAFSTCKVSRRAPRKRPRRHRKNLVTRLDTASSIVVPAFVHAGSTLQRDAGVWALDSVNANGWSSVATYLDKSTADFAMLQASKVLEGQPIASAERSAKTCGWIMAVSPALCTDAGGVSAGVALASHAFIGMARNSLEMVPDEDRSRIGCTHVNAVCEGGVHVLSLYMWCSEGLHPEKC
jgi:hypothetical protein